MADGSYAFNFPPPQISRLRPGEIVVDLFAGGGGASEALKQALGVDPALAYNHDEWAIGMHAANHPLTDHHREDIWHANPRKDVAGRPVGWFHASPDCTHFSQAKGGQPRNRKIRALTWVVLKWAGQLQRVGCAPRIISLENVRQILTWGPLVAKRDKATGRVVTLDMVPLLDDAGHPVKRRGKVVMVNRIADPGERVPVERQALVPDKRHAGRTWAQFVAALQALGYVVEWRILSAADYGAGTSRERLFLVARRDGEPIQWPEPTHGPGRARPHVPAADCLDFTIDCPSIFTRKRPLADATMRRIARGVMRHVIEADEPFIVPMEMTYACSDPEVKEERTRDVQDQSLGPAGVRAAGARRQAGAAGAEGRNRARSAPAALAPLLTEFANASSARTWSGQEPLRTACAGVKGGHFALVAPVMMQAAHGEGRPGGVKRWGTGVRDFRSPITTVTASGSSGQALIAAFLEQANGGGPNGNPAPARSCRQPVSAITASGSQQRLVTADLAQLSPEAEAGALRVAAFLVNYYGNGTALDLRDELPTVTTRDRMALVTVVIRGTPYVIVDIGLRMLRPHELYRAQGFPPDYIHDRTADGRPLTVTAQVRMVGNSVSPPPLRALVEANLDPVHAWRQAA